MQICRYAETRYELSRCSNVSILDLMFSDEEFKRDVISGEIEIEEPECGHEMCIDFYNECIRLRDEGDYSKDERLAMLKKSYNDFYRRQYIYSGSNLLIRVWRRIKLRFLDT